MAQQAKPGTETLGLRIHKDAIRTLKIVAAERRSNVSALTQEALALWWSQQPESKTKGVLFPEKSPIATTEEEPSPPKASPKTAAKKPTAKKTSSKKPSKK